MAPRFGPGTRSLAFRPAGLALVAALLLAACRVADDLVAADRVADNRVAADFVADNREEPLRRPPNVVLILADDLGWGELGCYGQAKIATPNLDALAREGLRFTQFYAGAPVCAPSRCTLLTGQHTGHAPVRDNVELQPEGQMALPAASITLAELLHARGYATACIGKWGLGAPKSEGEPLSQGFDHFFGYLCQRHAHAHTTSYLWRDRERVEFAMPFHSHDAFTKEALAFVEHERERPFFLYLAYTLPHLALDVPDDSLAAYRGRWDDPPYDGKNGYTEHPTPRAAYAAMVSRLDRDVGRLIARLGELGLGGDTLILFTSDNGPTHDRIGGSDSEFFDSTHGLRGLKGSVFEGGLRVPLIARMPGRIAAGVTSEHVAAAWDVLATVCELAGIAPPPGLDGVSFAPTLLASGRGESSASPPFGLGDETTSAWTAAGLGAGSQRLHDHLYWELASYGGQQAVRFGRWKAVRRRMRKGGLAIELFDLESDPAESRDLAAERPELVAVAESLLERARTPSETFPLGPKR
ncbi:MAG: arylsulfatase [Planctomycetes bacterium]|nr:arylsulfatase [Planctomycetota bacterium]